MKKTIPIAVIFVLLMVSVAFAPRPPMPIVLQTNPAVSGLDVKITNINTAETKIYQTNELGELVADWGNSNKGAYTGDLFTVELQGQIQKIKYANEGGGDFAYENGDYVNFLKFNVIAPCPSCIQKTCEIDKTLSYGEIYTNINSPCLVKVTAPDKPIASEESVAEALSALGFGLIAGAGAVFIYKRKRDRKIVIKIRRK